MKAKYLKSKTGRTFYRIMKGYHMAVSIFSYDIQVNLKDGLIYTESFLKENFVKSNEQDFNEALEKALHNIKNNLL